MAIENRFSRLEHAQYKNRVGKKMGFAVTGSQMGSVLCPAKSNSSAQKAASIDTKSFSSSGHANFQSIAPNADSDVVNAWYRAAAKTGVNGFDGTSTQMSALFAMQAEQKSLTGSSDLLGKDAASAAAAVKKAIGRLEGMKEERVNAKVAEYRDKEMKFYREFLAQLEG